ncbi:MAG TPA: penicillin-binding protein 1C [Spirochaetota bacterium]|nr:penicillin-binding protein 1C [Spirochaetota bacterium]HOL57360.1 penicillin-binding protein 1C [Spirochaetota bacterium]HPP04940.1 penicillin-binding protein 1C [Spirochaetota bacterium]
MKKGKNRNLKKTIFILIAIVLAITVIKVILFLIPYKELDRLKESFYSVKILDRNNRTIQVLPLDNGTRREFLLDRDIPRIAKEIFIKSEDKRFYFHLGVDLFALLRATWLNISQKKIVSGGSTITMQLSRIVSPQNKSIAGKFKEIINAIRIESKLTKNEILNLYLNSLPFGFNTIGVQSGAKIFFGKDFKSLSPAEILVLSLIPRNPSKYNPLNIENREAIQKKAIEIKKRIKLDIKEEDIINALENAKSYKYEFFAPHFVNYIKKYLDKNIKEVQTSLDLELNNFIQKKLEYYIEKYSNRRLTNGAVIVFDNWTGEILVYIGSKDFFDKENDGEIDGVQVLNQPGSTLKPFLYALAIDKFDFLPNTILDDVPSFFGGEEVYIPKNFNNRFNGPVRLRVALASSLNVPAVQTVVKIGVKNFVAHLIDLDFESIKKSKKGYGSGIAVGNAEVSLFEIAKAFSIFVRNGEKLNPEYLKVKKREFKHGKKIYSDYTSFIIADILSDAKSRTIGFGMTEIFNTEFQAMFKTGTSNQFNNIWAFGSTTNYTVGVWMGNFSGETVIGVTGSSIPARLVVEILNILHNKKKPDKFKIPSGITEKIICPLSGKKIGDNCYGGIYEYFKEGITLLECDWHKIENGKIKTILPPFYTQYLDKIENAEIQFNTPFIKKDVKILYPNNNACYYYDPNYPYESQKIKIEVFCKDIKESLSVYINNDFYKKISYPYNFFISPKRGKFLIEVKGIKDSDTINIEVK